MFHVTLSNLLSVTDSRRPQTERRWQCGIVVARWSESR